MASKEESSIFNNTFNGSVSNVNNISGDMNILNAEQSDTIKAVMMELVQMLSDSKAERKIESDIKFIVEQLLDETNKPKNKRDVSFIADALGKLANYINLAGFALLQADKARSLFEQVQKFFN
jgi:hypothetical protein